VVVSVLAALLVLGCGGGDDSSDQQSFVGSTTSIVLYVTWTRQGDELTGSLTQGVLDSGKDDVTTKRASLTGKVIGDGVSLDLNDPYGDASQLTGTLRGDTLDLEFLSGATGVMTVHMEQADGGDFNSELADLRDKAEQSKADETSAAAETAESNRVVDLALTVIDDVAALRTALGASLPSKGVSLKADLARLRRGLAEVKGNARKALAADTATVCARASLVESGADALARGVQALQDKQDRTTTGASTVDAAIRKLLDDYSELRAEDAKYLPSDVPTRETINRAIRSARRKVRKLGTSDRGAVDEARKMLKEAQDLKTRTSVACRTGGG